MINLKTLLIFFLTASLIIFLGFDFLKPAFDIGLSPEDREFILRYKLLGSNPLTKILQVWLERGAYSTVPIYYIGIVQSIAGFNYQLIQFIGVLFRTLAILSIFPLVTLVFKNIWLAVLTTIIFAFSYTTTGALETGVEPSEYLGFLMMNIFLISYYFLNTKYLLNLRWVIVAALLLFIAVMTSVMRIYPILFLLPIIEAFLFFSNRAKYKFKYLVVKLMALYLPFLILQSFSPVSTSSHFFLPLLLSKIAEGNWHLVLTPLQGLGYMLPIGKYYPNLGALELNSFTDYMKFLSEGPLIVFGFISFILSLISAKKKVFFFFRVLFLNFGLGTLTYWIVKHRLSMPMQLQINFDTPRLYSIFIGIFIFSLMINYLIDWYRQSRKNNLFLVLWLGPFIALFYITMTYFFAGLGLSFGGAQDHYLMIPTLGIALFISGILLMLHSKLSGSRIKISFASLSIVTILLMVYLLNREMTHTYFIGANFNGRSAAGQELLQGRIREIFKDLDYSKPALVYFDTTDIPHGKGPFYSEGLLTPFSTIMYFQGEKVVNGCIGVIYEDGQMAKLKELIKTIDNQQVIIYQTACVENSRINVQDVIYKTENLYALKIKDQDFIDIRDQVLQELDIK